MCPHIWPIKLILMTYRLTPTHFRNDAPMSETGALDETPDAELNDPHKQQQSDSKMVYVSNGQVLDSRTQSPWSLSFLGDLFWGVVEFIGLFFQTLIRPDMSKDGNPSSLSRFSDGRGPPGFPGRRRMGRINHGGGPSPPPMGGG